VAGPLAARCSSRRRRAPPALRQRPHPGRQRRRVKRVIDEEIKRVDESGVAAKDFYDKVVVGEGEQEARMISPFDD
jgi:hypothetical protein